MIGSRAGSGRDRALAQRRWSRSTLIFLGTIRRKASSTIAAISSQSTLFAPEVSRYTPSQFENVPLADMGGLKNRSAEAEMTFYYRRRCTSTWRESLSNA